MRKTFKSLPTLVVLLYMLVTCNLAAANSPPVALCQDVVVGADSGTCEAAGISVDEGSFDPDGDPITISQSPPEPYLLGDTVVTLTVTDSEGASDACEAGVRVYDVTQPDIDCGGPATGTITPQDAPISFWATATDNCDADPSVEIADPDCHAFTKKGKRIDKTESCQVNVCGDSITIIDSGGVGDHITWWVIAIDSSGNRSEYQCGVLVGRAGQ